MSAMNDTSMNTNMHAAFKREIRRIQSGLAKADLASSSARANLMRRYDFFSETLHHHHEGEDTYLFERVKPKADPSEVAILDQMEAEHGELLEILTTVDTGFKTLSDATDKVVLNDQLEALFTVLSQHCEHEETQGIQVVQRYITQEDMKEFMKFNREGEHANFVLPWICDGAQPAVSSQVWGMIPGPVRLFLKPTMTSKYDAFSKECEI